MRWIISRAVFLFSLILFSAQVFAATLYCDFTNGNDANNCTNGTTQLCKTLQRCVNVATGGDTINIANTSAQVLSAAITWNTGWTASNTNYTVFQAWDNGGSITIQRPDEATARVAATIDGNSAANIFSSTSRPQRVVLVNLKLTNTTSAAISGGDWWSGYGLEIYSIGNTDAALRTGSYSNYQNCWIRSFDDFGVWLEGISPTMENCLIDATSNTVVNAMLTSTEDYTFNRNVIIGKGATTAVRFNDADRGSVQRNTIIGDSTASASAIGISFTNCEDTVFLNNVFYKYNGSGSVPFVFTTSSTRALGVSGLYDCNAGTTTTNRGADLTGLNVTGSGDPFVDSANKDYTPDAASDLIGAAYPSGDLGAIQSAAGGGGGSSEHAYTWVN